MKGRYIGLVTAQGAARESSARQASVATPSPLLLLLLARLSASSSAAAAVARAPVTTQGDGVRNTERGTHKIDRTRVTARQIPSDRV